MIDKNSRQDALRRRWKLYGTRAAFIILAAAAIWFILFKLSDADASTLATLTVGLAAAAIAHSQYKLTQEIEARATSEERMRRTYESPRIEITNFHPRPFGIEVKIRNSGLSPALTLSATWNTGTGRMPTLRSLGSLPAGQDVSTSCEIQFEAIEAYWQTPLGGTDPISLTLEWDSVDGPKTLSAEIPDDIITQTWWHSIDWAHTHIYGYSYIEDVYGLPRGRVIPNSRPDPDDIREANELSERLREERMYK